MGLLDINGLSNNPIQALPQRCFWVYIDSVCGMDSPFMSHTTHTVWYTPKNISHRDVGVLEWVCWT